MSAEWEEREDEKKRLHKSLSRLRNRKNERKRRKRDRLIAELGKWCPARWIGERDGKERVYARDKSAWKEDMKRCTARAVRKEEDIPDGNAYKKVKDKWDWEW